MYIFGCIASLYFCIFVTDFLRQSKTCEINKNRIDETESVSMFIKTLSQKLDFLALYKSFWLPSSKVGYKSPVNVYAVKTKVKAKETLVGL